MSERSKDMLDWCLSCGDKIGKLVSFFGLPALLFGALVYSQELIDRVSEPDVTANIELVSLRCAYVFRSSEQVRDYNQGDDSVLTDVCDEADTSVSFAVNFFNEDSILRTIVDLRAVVTTPFGGQLDLKFARQQVHQVVGIAETQVRTDWTPLEIRAHRGQKREPWIEPSRPEDALKWGLFRELLNSGLYSSETQVFDFELFADFEHWSAPVIVASCLLTMEPDQVVRFNQRQPYEQIQITISCDPKPAPRHPRNLQRF